MADPISERLDDELQLLQAMYPEQIRYDRIAREVVFSHVDAKLVLRLPQTYPEKGAPEAVLARGAGGRDLREVVRRLVREVSDDVGGDGEVLDEVLGRFRDVVDSQDRQDSTNVSEQGKIGEEDRTVRGSKTVVIWLHHLLATSKRKLAISPTGSHDKIKGVTKPGHPGVMVFSGERTAVEEHVAELKGLNWQAFAIRYETDELWAFEEEIREVETMAEVVQCIEESRREEFLKAVGVK
jgi:hypothetical protein